MNCKLVSRLRPNSNKKKEKKRMDFEEMGVQADKVFSSGLQ
jgi:hypothetical protein